MQETNAAGCMQRQQANRPNAAMESRTIPPGLSIKITVEPHRVALALASLLVVCRCATTGSADAHDALPLYIGVLNCTDEVTRLRLANVLREVPTAVAVFESTSVVPLQLVDVVALGVHPDRVLFVPTLYGSTLRYGGLWPLPRVCCWRVGLNRHTW